MSLLGGKNPGRFTVHLSTDPFGYVGAEASASATVGGKTYHGKGSSIGNDVDDVQEAENKAIDDLLFEMELDGYDTSNVNLV